MIQEKKDFKDLIKKYKLKTGETKKLKIFGEVKNLSVYRVPLKYLYYNDENERIITYISQFREKLEIMSIDEKNNHIEEYIYQDNPRKLNDTKDKIQKDTQLVAGVISSDGRVLDGNRRFTCLRKLDRETKNDKWKYFNCAVLEGEYENLSYNDIKQLEYNLQNNEEAKVGYHNIERLAGMYRNVMIEGLNDKNNSERFLTRNEYMSANGIGTKKFNKDLEILKTMVAYLKWINKPLQFHIARSEELFESFKITTDRLKKYNTDSEIRIKLQNYCFTMMKSKFKKDNNRSVSAAILEFLKYYEKHPDEQVNEKLEEFNETLSENYEDIITASDKYKNQVKKKLKSVYLDMSRKLIAMERKNEPIEVVDTAVANLNGIDGLIFKSMSDLTKKEFNRSLEVLEECVEKLRKGIDGEL
jgi:hypothetical protein